MNAMAVSAFCIPGRHASGSIDGSDVDGVTLPEGWKLVRATHMYNRWIARTQSPASVCCCPDHLPQDSCDRCGRGFGKDLASCCDLVMHLSCWWDHQAMHVEGGQPAPRNPL